MLVNQNWLLIYFNTYVEVEHTYHANEVLLPVIYTVLGCLGWPDGTVLKRGVWTANKLIPILLSIIIIIIIQFLILIVFLNSHFVDDPRYHQLLGREMIITAVKALASNRNPENALDLLGLFFFH